MSPVFREIEQKHFAAAFTYTICAIGKKRLSLNREGRATPSHPSVTLVRIASEVQSAKTIKRFAVSAGWSKARESSSSHPLLLLPFFTELCSIWVFKRIRKARHYRDRGTRHCLSHSLPLQIHCRYPGSLKICHPDFVLTVSYFHYSFSHKRLETWLL